MTRLTLAVPALLLVLAGCGDDTDTGSDTGGDEPGGGGRTAPVSACGDLTDADVERLTGIAVTHEEKQQLGTSTCTFTGDGTPLVMVLAAPGDDGIEELVEAGRVGDSETTTEDVDVPGTEAAVLVSDTAYEITSTSLVATTGSVGYTVYGTGPTAADEGRVAVAALTILLGGTSDDPGVGPQAHPCDVLTADEVGRVLGSPVRAERGTLGVDSPQCTYAGSADPEVDLSVYTLDRTAPVETVVGNEERAGADVEPLDVAGATAAYVVSGRGETDSALAYLATTQGTFVLDVDADDEPRSVELARRLVGLMAP